MPYINSTVSVKLSEEQKDYIKAEFGKIITKIPGKTEEYLMVSFNDDNTIYFAGEKKDKAAYIDIRLLGSNSREYKNEVSKLITELFENYLKIPGRCIYISFNEFKDWAWNGNLF